MISISVDQAAAFDMLSILGVKSGRDTSNAVALSATRLANEIAEQIGAELYVAIIDSPEFTALFETNERLFQLIDDIKARGEQVGDATAIDQANYQRFLGKRAIQDTFFPAAPLSEVKIGYA